MLSLSSCQQKEFMNRSGALFTSEQLGSFSTIFAFGSMPTGSADRDEGDGVFIIRASIVNENLINNTNDISLELAQLPKQINSSDDVCSYLLGKLKKKIYSYLELDENWDGHEGVAPSKSCIDDAITFLSNIPASCLPDRVGVSGDGEIVCFGRERGYMLISVLLVIACFAISLIAMA